MVYIVQVDNVPSQLINISARLQVKSPGTSSGVPFPLLHNVQQELGYSHFMVGLLCDVIQTPAYVFE